ncbi:MAG: hypothetical protein P1U64_07835 [Alcanivoracaceae bacterium]|nr:hypothetical protein [Alcanivoracaceae bacterium]
MRSAFFLTAALLLATAPGLANEPDNPDAGECTSLYQSDDPALFDFVDTRKAVSFAQYAGRTIGTVEYRVLPIFNEADPDENNWAYRTLNKLHIETRPATLKKQMIISAGDTLDPETLYENERTLRDNDYLVDAMILPARVCANSIDLLVVVRDVWTFSPSASASRSGGDNSFGAGLSEKNLLGTGQELSVGYFSDSDRSGKGFAWRIPQLFGTQMIVDLEYSDNSDGQVVGASLARPFYRLDSRWSAGLTFDEEQRTDTIEVNDLVTNRYDHQINTYEAYVGWSPGLRGDKVHRWYLGVTEAEEVFERVDIPPSNPPADERLVYPWLAWEYTEDRYWTTSNISRSHRQEDILLGTYSYVRMGYSDTKQGSTRNAIVYSMLYNYTASFGDHHLLRSGLSADGEHDTDTDAPNSTFFGAAMQYYNFIDRKNRWYAHLRFNGARNIREDEQLTTGGNDTLRGYPSDIQRGNRRWLFTLERRHFTDIHLFNLAYLGGAAYVDTGRTWDTQDRNPLYTERTLTNVGLGLRLSPSKFRIEKVLHVDVAVPLVERDNIDGYQLIVSGRVDF